MTDTPEKPRTKTYTELEWERPKLRATIKTRLQPLSEKFKAAMLSPARLEHLRLQRERYKAEHGGRGPTTAGVVHGWAGKAGRRSRVLCIAAAERKAERVIDKLITEGKLDKSGAGHEILKWATAVVLAKDGATGKSCYSVKDQLAAAKIVLEYTTAKPESKAVVSVTAENFLQTLLEKESTSPK